MKKIAVLIAGLIFCCNALTKAQDTIVLINRNKVLSKVLEISSKYVKYKDFTNLEGPDYVLEKEEILSIIFQNGKIQKFNEATEEGVEYINDVPIRNDANRPVKREYGWSQQNQEPTRTDGYKPKIAQRYSENKLFYDPRQYRREYDDPFNPVLAGVSSYFLPGLGQMISGETARGFAFLGGTYGCYILAGVGMAMAGTFDYYDYYNGQQYSDSRATSGAILGIIGILGGMSLHIYSIVDAVQVAKVNNMYFQDMRENYYSLELKPFVGTPNRFSPIKDQPLGLTLSLSF